MKQVSEQYDIVVCGGGLAGFCAAVAAARQGRKTCIIQNRPVFGGNSSSEIGVTPHGAAAFHAYARETGILSELLIEERAANHAEIYENGWTNSVWDMVLYDMAVRTENLNFYLNTDFKAVRMKDNRHIQAIVAHVQNAELELTLEAELFIDCTGDGLVAHEAGCEWRMGSESRSEFNEPHAPEVASGDVMGSSIHFKAQDMGRPVPFSAPEWAIRYDDASYFYDQGRLPKEERGGFWWLEIGVPYHTIHDNETIRHELTRHALGVWHWMKNQDPVMKERTRNYALDWIGQVPGKRESRRIMGEYFITEHDIQNKTVFEDEIAFGGWFIDLHTPGGLLAAMSEPTNADNYNTFNEYSVKSYCGPYGVPLRSLIARDVDNLMMAGRNISTTHAALGTLRVMATTALMGQAAGTAAAIAQNNQLAIKETPEKVVHLIKQKLLRDGCFLINNRNEDPADLARFASVTASSESGLTGAGPDTEGFHEGLSIWRDQPQYDQERLDVKKGQMIALGNEGITTLSVFLKNLTADDQNVSAALFSVSDIWDYRTNPGTPLKTASLRVPANYEGWVEWPVNFEPGGELKPYSYVRIDLEANASIAWKVAGCVLPGQLAVYQIGKDKMRRFSNGATLSFRIEPAQYCFPPENVINGVTRPHRYTNLWRSDEAEVNASWIQLSWDQVHSIGQVEITFPGHLLREYHAYAPFYRDQQCAKDYRIEISTDGRWEEVMAIRDNYQRHRIHRLKMPVETNAIRIVIDSTHGDPCAGIYEVRCYRDI
ncbi:MAG: FAD-dependent oxidoreductase [Bacteroidia bacterium]